MNLLDKLDSYLYWNIMDFAKGSPRNNYRNVMTELEYNTKVRCNKNCRYFLLEFNGEMILMPVLIKTSHAICTICKRSPLSEYDHRYCDRCATKGTYEYNYHHRLCKGFDIEKHLIID